MLELAKREVHSAQYAKIKSAAVGMKNEVLEMIANVTKRKSSFESLSKFTADKEQLFSIKHCAEHISDFAGISEPIEIDRKKMDMF